MTYRKLYESATRKLEKSEITLGEYEEMTKPLDEDVRTWISVNEDLPEKNVWVLVTVEQNGRRYQEIMRRNNYTDTWTDNIDIYTDEITAWMPLPKPYEPQESEEISREEIAALLARESEEQA